MIKLEQKKFVERRFKAMDLALYCDDASKSRELQKMLAQMNFYQITLFDTAYDFTKFVSGRSDIIMVLILSGAPGTETAMSAKEQAPNGKLIWFSDMDFSLLSYRIHADYFGMLPVDNEKIKNILQNVAS